jgi:predicted AAA+ superfamily ATPase
MIPRPGSVRVPAVALQRFWTMVAHCHGQIWNAAEAARALGVNESTARRYLDLLSDAQMVRQLQPWHANLTKRHSGPRTTARRSI